MYRTKKHYTGRFLAYDLARKRQVYRNAYQHRRKWKGIYFYIFEAQFRQFMFMVQVI